MAEMIKVHRPAFVERAEKYLDGVTDRTLLLLKAHLLLEEALHSAIRAKCANPEYFDKIDLSFFECLQMARALYPVPSDDEKQKQTMGIFWDAAEALNNLRNRLAHDLEPKNLAPLFDRLGVRYKQGEDTLSNPNVVNNLGLAVSMLIGYAWGMRSRDDEKPL